MVINTKKVQKQNNDLPPAPMKATMTENREYRADVSWPTMKELTDAGVPDSFIQENEVFYKLGMNRQRQKQESVNDCTWHLSEILILKASRTTLFHLK